MSCFRTLPVLVAAVAGVTLQASVALAQAPNLAGQTIRVRMTSTNDFFRATSFYFDTLSLRALRCP